MSELNALPQVFVGLAIVWTVLSVVALLAMAWLLRRLVNVLAEWHDEWVEATWDVCPEPEPEPKPDPKQAARERMAHARSFRNK